MKNFNCHIVIPYAPYIGSDFSLDQSTPKYYAMVLTNDHISLGSDFSLDQSTPKYYARVLTNDHISLSGTLFPFIIGENKLL